jgi:hypothetical protein
MEADADLRAYDAVAELSRAEDLADVGRAVLAELARARTPSFPSAEAFGELLRERNLSREDAATPFGNALDVLQRGPEDEAERLLAKAVAARSLLLLGGAAADERLASDLLWLAAQTPFDATGLVDRALGERAKELWGAVAERLRRIDAGHAPELGHGAALVAAAALAGSHDATAREQAAKLAGQVRDAKVARVLAAAEARGEQAAGAVGPLRGELSAAPRGPVVTVLLGLSGVLLAMYAARLLARVAFAYRKPAEVSVSDDGGVRVRWRTELLGRTLGDGDVLVPRVALARAAREVRYPRLLLNAGLVALALGSYLGVAAFVDGVRAASPSLLATGLAVICLGLALDFAVFSIAPAVQGKCRLVFMSRDGRTLCIAGVETGLADAFLARLSRR